MNGWPASTRSARPRTAVTQRDPGRNRVHPEAGGTGGGGRREQVLDVEPADERRVDPGDGAGATVDDGQRGPGAAEHDVGRADVGVRVVDRVGPDVEVETDRVVADAHAVRIVDVRGGRGDARRIEERELRLEVVLHRTVVVEVLVAEVGEARGGEPHGVDPTEVERARRDLHA